VQRSAKPAEADAAAERARELRRLPASVLGARLLLDQWRRVLAHEPGTRSGADPEDLHKLRVALRRFRAVAQVFGKDVDRAAVVPISHELAADARAVAGTTNRLRDVDVFITYLQREAENAHYGDLPAIQRLIDARQSERRPALGAVTAALEAPPMQRLREIVVPRLASLAVTEGSRAPKKRRLARRGPALVVKRLRALRRLRPTLLVPDSAALHRVRIAAKKLRYTAEFLAPVFPETLVDVARLATEIQDTLGEVHDLDLFGLQLLTDLEEFAQPAADAPEGAPSAGERIELRRMHDSGSVARLLRRAQERREDALVRFPPLWDALPSPSGLRKQLARELRAGKRAAHQCHAEGPTR
jgi:CHAD domain-containing protein